METHKTKMAGTSRNQELEAAAHWMLLYGMLVTLSLWNYLYTEDLDVYFIGASVQCTAMCALALICRYVCTAPNMVKRVSDCVSLD